jgi:hypothetical protein
LLFSDRIILAAVLDFGVAARTRSFWPRSSCIPTMLERRSTDASAMRSWTRTGAASCSNRIRRVSKIAMVADRFCEWGGYRERVLTSGLRMRAKLDRTAEAAAEKRRYIMESVGDDVTPQPGTASNKIFHDTSPTLDVPTGVLLHIERQGSKRGTDCSGRNRRRGSLVADGIAAKICCAAAESSRDRPADLSITAQTVDGASGAGQAGSA